MRLSSLREATLLLAPTNVNALSDIASNRPREAASIPIATAWSELPCLRGIGDIAAGGVGEAVYTISWSGEQFCSDAPRFVLSFRPKQEVLPGFALPVVCPGFHIAQEEVFYGGGDHDFMPEHGEEIEIWVSLSNTGTEDVDVKGTLSIETPGVSVVRGEGDWGQLEPEMTARIQAPFVVRIAADAPLRKGMCENIGVPAGSHPVFAAEMKGSISIRATDFSRTRQVGSRELPFENLTLCRWVPGGRPAAIGDSEQPRQANRTWALAAAILLLVLLATITARRLFRANRPQ